VIGPLPKSIRKKLSQPDTPEDARRRAKILMVLAVFAFLMMASDYFHWCRP
jgi:hypothetical protein